MKKTKLFHLVAVLLLSSLLCAGAHAQRVDAREFMAAARDIGQLNSAKHTEFIGATASRVYLERWRASSMGGDGIAVIWIPRAELPADFVENLVCAASRPKAK